MRLLRPVAWIALVLAGSIAAAGLVVSLDHAASGDARPELTARDSALLAPRLAAIDAPLGRLADAARALSGAGRDALVGLRALDLPAVAEALDAGDLALGRLTIAADEVRGEAPSLLDGLGDGARLPAADRARVVAIAAAGDGADALVGAWADVRRSTVAPIALVGALHTHDDAVTTAAGAGRDARYRDALASLDAAAGALTDAIAVRDAAAGSGRDLTMIDGWLARLADHDAALRVLYTRLIASGGVRTADVEVALAALSATQAALPETQAGLVSAVTDIGAGDITPALLTIEDVRGMIEAALPTTDE